MRIAVKIKLEDRVEPRVLASDGGILMFKISKTEEDNMLSIIRKTLKSLLRETQQQKSKISWLSGVTIILLHRIAMVYKLNLVFDSGSFLN